MPQHGTLSRSRPRRLIRAGVVLAAATCLLPSVAAFPAATAAGAPDHGPRSVLVRFQPGIASATRRSDAALAGGVFLGRIYGLPVEVIRVPAGTTAAAFASRYASLPGVLYAEPNATVHAAAGSIPDDPSFGLQYGLNNTGQSGGAIDADIDAPEGWAAAGLEDFPRTGGVPIGIIDSGLDTRHPEFAGRIVACVHRLDGTGRTPRRGCRDRYGHGTHVTGIAAASANNGVGVAGVSFDSPIMVCRALNGTGSGTTSDVAACILWLHDHGAKVINMSLVGGRSRAIRDAVAIAWDGGSATGTVMTAAAGNDGRSICEYPACYPEVVSVAATDRADHHAVFSDFNSKVEVSAPGVDVYSTLPGGYGTLSGTSMASPVAAGVAAFIWHLHRGFTAGQVRAALDVAVDDLGTPGRDPFFGFGRLNLCDAAGAKCPYGAANDGTASVHGTVSAGGSPRPASVTADGPETVSVRADPEGQYIVPILEPGTYVLKAKARGCSAQKRSVTLGSGDDATVDFSLSCSATP